MANMLVTTTAKGIEVITLTSGTLCKRHVAILTIASRKPSPTVNHLFHDVRIARDTALTMESLAKDVSELSSKGYVKVHP